MDLLEKGLAHTDARVLNRDIQPSTMLAFLEIEHHFHFALFGIFAGVTQKIIQHLHEFGLITKHRPVRFPKLLDFKSHRRVTKHHLTNPIDSID